MWVIRSLPFSRTELKNIGLKSEREAKGNNKVFVFVFEK